jgi:hypothetical protein
LYRCERKGVAGKGFCKAMKTQGIKIDEERGDAHAVLVIDDSFGVPIPRVFCRKSVDLFDSKGVDAFGAEKEFGRVCGERS